MNKIMCRPDTLAQVNTAPFFTDKPGVLLHKMSERASSQCPCEAFGFVGNIFTVYGGFYQTSAKNGMTRKAMRPPTTRRCRPFSKLTRDLIASTNHHANQIT